MCTARLHFFKGKEVYVQDQLCQRPGWVFRQLDVTEEQAQKLFDWCKRRKGHKFNYVGFYGYAFPCFCCVQSCFPNRWFCSELVATALKENNIANVTVCSPHDLYRQLQNQAYVSNPKVKQMQWDL
jgi:hypothetical protein